MGLSDSKYINRTELAHELGVSVATIRNWIKFYDFPAPVQSSGKTPIFRAHDVIDMVGKRGVKCRNMIYAPI